MDNFNIKLPDDVQFIIHTLQSHGFEAYAVGGCVRDSILGREPGDWDITTSAMPEETKALFDKTFDTGIEHGTITVLLNHEGYEVTTYRIDGKYEDSRHPKEVTFTRNLKEDQSAFSREHPGFPHLLGRGSCRCRRARSRIR